MPATISRTGFDQQSFDAFLAARREPKWLTEQRREAWRTFCAMDWFSRSAEEWIRTDIRLFKLNQYSLPIDGSAGADLTQPLLTAEVELAGRTTALDSRPLATHLKAQWVEKGVIFGSL